MDPFAIAETIGVLFGALGVCLTIRQNIWCWPVGIVNVTLFLAVFLHARFYGAMALQAVYLALSLYGWHAWQHGQSAREALAVSSAPQRWLVTLLPTGIVCGLAFGLFFRYRTNAAMPYWDAGTTAFSLVAQIMTTRKWIENWIVWIAVDTVYIGMFLAQGLFPTAGLYMIFLAMAAVGYHQWRKEIKIGPPAGGPP